MERGFFARNGRLQSFALQSLIGLKDRPKQNFVLVLIPISNVLLQDGKPLSVGRRRDHN
jgi:hypothetical protein